MKAVYVAGAYSADNVIDVLANMRRGLELSVAVLQAGYAPFSPWLDFQFGLHADITIDQYYDYSMAWLRKSDAVLLVPDWEHSRGTRAEIREANRLDIPVFEDMESLEHWDRFGECLCTLNPADLRAVKGCVGTP